MIAAQILSPLKTRLTELEPPTLKPHDVLIEIKRAGICGTDLHIWDGSYALANYPVVPGHEFCGVVAAIGDKVNRFKIGDRVTADPNVPCEACEFCQAGQYNQCLNLEVIGVTRNGAFAKYVTAPESVTFDIGSISFAQAALIEPLACVAWGLKQVQVQPGDNVLIFGAGPMGSLMMQAVKSAGAASVVMVDKEDWRLDLAKPLGATQIVNAANLSATTFKDIAPHGFHIVADATGVPKVIEQTFTYVRPGGKVWIFGVAGSDQKANFVPYDVFRKDLKIIGSFALNKTFPESIAMIQRGAVKVDTLISHTLPLEQFEEGLQLAAKSPTRMKIQFSLD
jgi:2-desacetyl-2-hydroxyethyl bacteriochlorophyllide A dehydrogenase